MAAALAVSPRSRTDEMSDLPMETPLGSGTNVPKTSFPGVSRAGFQRLGMRDLDDLLLRQNEELRVFLINLFSEQGRPDPFTGEPSAARPPQPVQAPAPSVELKDAPLDRQVEPATETAPEALTGPGTPKEGQEAQPQGSLEVGIMSSNAHATWNFSEDHLKGHAKSKTSRKSMDTSESSGEAGSAVEHTGVWWFVKHRYFEAGVAIAIFLSSLVVGVEVEYCAMHQLDIAPWPFLALQYIFAFVFVTELGLRVAADGLKFIIGMEKFWALFDFVTVFIALLELVINHVSTSPTPVLLFARIIRIVRVVRVIRMIRFLAELKLMIYSILSTFRSLFWSLVLMVMVLYLCSVCLTQATTLHLLEIEGTQNTYAVMLKNDFGSLSKTGFTLFKAVMGGVSWGEPMELLSNLHWIYFAVFLMYISFTLFAFLNVITGFFCENALDLAEQDKEQVIAEQLKNKAKYCAEFETIFAKMDEDQSGEITFDELEAHLDSDALVAYFHHLNLEIHQAWDIFRLLDLDGSGSISLTEFVEGCLKLRGPAKKVDVAEIGYQVAKVQMKLGEFMIFVQHCLVALAKGEELPVPKSSGRSPQSLPHK